MKKISRSSLLAIGFIFITSIHAMAIESIYSETYTPTVSTFTEDSANEINYYFVYNYNFLNQIAGSNIDHFKLNLNFSNFNNDEQWDAQVWVGPELLCYDYGSALNGLKIE